MKSFFRIFSNVDDAIGRTNFAFEDARVAFFRSNNIGNNNFSEITIFR